MSPFHRKALQAAASVALAMGCVQKAALGPDEDLVAADRGAGHSLGRARPEHDGPDSGGPDSGSGSGSALSGEVPSGEALYSAGTDAWLDRHCLGPDVDGSVGWKPSGPPLPPARGVRP
jgi:hypothetical protein